MNAKRCGNSKTGAVALASVNKEFEAAPIICKLAKRDKASLRDLRRMLEA